MAVFPTGAGHPDFSGNFLPTIFSGKTIAKFYAASVVPAIASTDHESEISGYGDKVVIRTVPDIAVSSYSMGQSLNVQVPDSTSVELPIDKGWYFNVSLDDVAKVQSDLSLMDMYSSDASERLKIKVDTDVLANIDADVASTNKGATAGALSGDINLGTTTSPIAITTSAANVITKIIDMGLVMDEANLPETNRWLVIPAWVAALIKTSDLKDASITGDSQSIMRNGRLGVIDRFTVYSSNNLPKVNNGTKDVFRMFAGVKEGLAFAAQITNTETLRSERTFGTLLRGLTVYGRKVIKGDAIVSLACSKS